MTTRADVLNDSVERMKAAHYAVCPGCYTCKGAAGGFAAPVARDTTTVAVSDSELPKGTGEPKPVNPGVREAIEFLAGYQGTWQFMLTLKGEMSEGKLRFTDRVIEVILNCKAREDAKPKPPVAAPVAAPVVEATDGWYMVDGVVVKVQMAVHGSGKPYAKRLNIEDGHGSWEYVPGLVRECTPERRLTAEQAMEMGQLYGVCVVCGATLTDEQSIARGIGPICFGKLSVERGFGAE
jgi:hypothetical protein